MFEKSSTVLVVALEDELPKVMLPGWRICYTGVGKINATFYLFQEIMKYKPETIVNFGTAGSLRQDLSGLQEVSIFKQRDMDASGLSFPIGETPFDTIDTIDNARNGLSCGTGDSFVKDSPKLLTDLVDMEAYAHAKVCKLLGINFFCFKYISDEANQNAELDWNSNLKRGSESFVERFTALNGCKEFS
ncbi:MAG: adenosylhomocysteine nucleosidase [Paracoccaceae bacterium]